MPFFQELMGGPFHPKSIDTLGAGHAKTELRRARRTTRATLLVPIAYA